MRFTPAANCLVLSACLVMHLHAQDKVYQTSATTAMTMPKEPVTLSKKDRTELVRGLEQTLRLNNENYAELADPGGGRAFVRKYINPVTDAAIDVLSGTEMRGNLPDKFKGIPSGLGILAKWRDKVLAAGDAEGEVYRVENVFQKSEAANGYFAKLRTMCNNDVGCISENADKVMRNDKIRKQVGADFEVFNDATVRQLVIASAQNADVQHAEALKNIQNLGDLVNVGVDQLSVQLSEVSEAQHRVERNTAQIMHTQELHTAALMHIQSTIDKNNQEIQNRLNQGFTDVMALQQKNIFLTSVVLENTRAIQSTLVPISQNVDKIRARQLEQIFDEAPTAKKLAMLRGAEGREMYGDDLESRAALIIDLEEMLKMEKVVAATNAVREFGQVGKLALDVVCPDCPPELNQVLGLGMTAADIVGNVMTSNWSGAITAGLSLFSKPKPSPELIMLKEIKKQLQQFEAGVNNHLNQIQQQLVSMEENIVARMQLVDAKLDMISDQVQRSYASLSEQLSSIDRKVSYVIRQQGCSDKFMSEMIKILTTGQCARPVEDFTQRVAAGNVNSYEDLRAPFIGQQFKGCIEGMFGIINQPLEDSRLFQYAECRTTDETPQSRPDRLYEFIYNNLLEDRDKNDPLAVYAMLLAPIDVTVAAGFKDSLAKLPQAMKEKIVQSMARLRLGDNEKMYRNYEAVLTFTNYALTMLPFLELYNNGELMTYQQLARDAAVSKERSTILLRFFDNVDELIDRTIFQQLLMSGAGTLKAVSNYIRKNPAAGQQGGPDVTLDALFKYNPYFARNYASWFVHSKYSGYKGLKRILEKPGIRNNPDKKIDVGYVSLIESDKKGGFVLSVATQDGVTPFFQSRLPAIGDKTNELLYGQYLAYAVPKSVVELYEAKNRVNALRAELQFMQSGALDKPGAPLSRKNFNAVLQESKP